MDILFSYWIWLIINLAAGVWLYFAHLKKKQFTITKGLALVVKDRP